MRYETIMLDGMKVQYRIIPKNNKNTYFKFRKNGTIEITKSRYQTKRDIIKYMKNNAVQFAEKVKKVKIVPTLREGYYSYFGKELKIVFHDQLIVQMDVSNNVVYLPSKELDSDSRLLRKTERDILLYEVALIEEKYQDNSYVNIENIKIKTRHTKTRFGSCNSKRRSINLNTNLVHYDKKYLEYVFLHEICHLTYQNHSREYYDLLEKICPNYKAIRKELKEIYR